jgi:ribonuclease D
MALSLNGIAVEVHTGDLPDGLSLADRVAIDTETTGLSPHRDRLCLVQLTDGTGVCHLVHFPPQVRQAARSSGHYQAPNLAALLADPATTKLFHFGRFDIGMLFIHLGLVCRPVYCTKIASRLVRTYTDRHGLKDLCRELLGVEISKEQQSSDWGADDLSEDQMRYAATDVIHLHRLADRLEAMLAREGRADLARACFEFLPERARLDAAGWANEDIFAY